MDGRLLRFLGRSGKRAAGGLELRLIPAAALLQARSEAEHLAQGDAQALGLCLNACILARAAFDRDGRAAFQSGADVLALTTDSNVAEMKKTVENVISVPETHTILQPSLGVVPLQLFAYYVALLRGCDIDKPRNLAKSVTVE